MTLNELVGKMLSPVVTEGAIVLVMPCSHGEALVPSTVVQCSICGSDSWLSAKTGASTVGLARTLGGREPDIVCAACLDAAMGLLEKLRQQ